MSITTETERLLTERYGTEHLVALATSANDIPTIRNVNAVYAGGCFWTLSLAGAAKLGAILGNPHVAISLAGFAAHGTAEICGTEEHRDIVRKLEGAFRAWLGAEQPGNGDAEAVLIRIALTDAVLFADGKRHDLVF
ncbi:MAG: pyridoxamine 5'-phosphate oxidase family protein [Clostridia bacterium]|nr:pyridoxamine 5'-phosphate oxidase family protein [Clostridia bacterium]